MEVLSKVKKEKKLKDLVKGIVLTGNDLFELQQAVQKTLETSTSMKGKHVRLFLNNLEVIDPIVVPLVEKHAEVIKEYVKKDDLGKPIRDENGFHFDSKKDKDLYEKKSDAIFFKEITVSLKTFSSSVFDEIEFNMSKNDTVYLILRHLVTED